MKKINIKGILNKPIVKGALMELVSYVPMFGDDIASSIEKFTKKEQVNLTLKQEFIVKYVSKGIVALVVMSLVFGWIDADTFKTIMKYIGG